MSKHDLIRKELTALHDEGTTLLVDFQKDSFHRFQYAYQDWYTRALRGVATLAPERLVEFRLYYEADPKRKGLTYGTFVIQDFIKGIAPSAVHHADFDCKRQVSVCFYNQLTILKSIGSRIGSILSDIEGELYADLKDSEISVARKLIKVSPRAAGALAGVVVEGHLQKVAAAHGVAVAKKSPTIADLNDPLKAAMVIDVPTWRKVGYLADLRNLCSHKKDTEPTKEQVGELIDGTEWLIKNVF